MEIEGYLEKHGDRGIESKSMLKEKNKSIISSGTYFNNNNNKKNMDWPSSIFPAFC